MKKQLLSIIFALLPMLAMADASGSCGENVTYTYNSTTKTLTILGSGAMYDYGSEFDTPWRNYHFDDIRTIIVQDGVTSIGSGAFSGCFGLASITIPNSVTSIGSYAFESCSGLTSITIPNSVTSIGISAFRNCSSLTSVTIGNSVTSIGESAFSGCSGLTSVTIPNSVTSIGNEAFNGCSGLTSIIVELENTKYDSRNNCNAIIKSSNNKLIAGCSTTIIPNTVTSIGQFAFSCRSGLTSITIPNSVTSIDGSAFYSCTGLTSITIPNSVTSIGGGAFRNCSGLTSITIPNSVTSIGDEAFYNCSGLSSVEFHCAQIGSWFSGMSSIKEVTIGNEVTSIGEKAFMGCSGLTSVTIPNSVTSIGQYAFSGCSGLTSVYIGNSVTSVGNYAFSGCSSLQKVIVPDIAAWCGIGFADNSANPLYYVHHIYSDENTEITDLVIPNSVTSIGNFAFINCSNLTSVTIPNSVSSIGSSAFQNCTGFTSLTIPSSITSIGNSAFSGCSGLTSVEFHCPQIGSWFNSNTSIKDIIIGNEVTSIGEHAFGGCSSLSSVEFHCAQIGSWFSGMTSIKEVTIGNEVTSIGEQAFKGCSGMTSVTMPNSVTSIGSGAFQNCSGLQKVIVSDIAAWCAISFANNSDNPLCYAHHIYSDKNTEITEIVIPEGVNIIGQYAFYNCENITSVTIPSSVTSIGKNAFSCGIKLSTVNVNMNIPIEIDESVFEFTGENYSKDIIYLAATLNVPIGSKALYSNVKGWKKFMNINEVDFTPKHKLVYVVDGVEYKVYEIAEGATITPEPAPTKEGYTFSGWSEIPETMPAYDVTVTGTFSINKYKLTYKVDGVEYKSYELEYGAEITPEPTPTKEGYTFSGWSEIPETMPAHDVTVTGTFSINKYKLTYKVDGVEYKSYELEYGATITPEPAPTKEGYTFSGWSEIPETMPAYDVTVTGSFAVNQYLITYMIGDEVYQKEYVDYGATIVLPNVPEREGYSFAWIDAPEKMPAHDITINGAYMSGIWGVSNDDATTNTYTISGYKTDKPRRGVNIIRMSDGTTRKVVVK